METKKMQINHDIFSMDDVTLIRKYKELETIMREKFDEFQYCAEHRHDVDYLKLVMTRLAYCFTKEKFSTLFQEIKKRGLLIG